MITSLTVLSTFAKLYTTKKSKATLIILRQWFKKIRSIEMKKKLFTRDQPTVLVDDESSINENEVYRLEQWMKIMVICKEELERIADENQENEWREFLQSVEGEQ